MELTPLQKHKDREKRLEYIKEWGRNNRDKTRLAGQRYRLKDTARRLLNTSKKRASKDGIAWNLVKEDIYVPDLCPVFQVPFEYGTRYAASLDRIDNSKGYVKDNIQVISRQANKMKSNGTSEELKMFANWILKNV